MTTCRFCFAVTGVLRFLSHLDLLKLFNRALLRAGLPAAYSEGFNPHPKLTFGPPRSVGVEGLAEWGDLTLREEIAPEEIMRRLNAALPNGVRLTSARLLPPGPHPALMAAINLTVYEAEFVPEADMAELAANVRRFLAADKWEIERRHPRKGVKTVDLRRGVAALALDGHTLTLEIPFAETGAVKPFEVMREIAPAGAAYLLRRVGLYTVNAAGGRELP